MLEIMVLIGTFMLLVVIGALSALSESFAQKRESKWAFSAVSQVENASKTIQPVDEASSYGTILIKDAVTEIQLEDNTILFKQIINNEDLVEFSHSEITEEVNNNLNQIVNAINIEMDNHTEGCNNSHLGDEIKNKIKEVVGEKTAGLVTNLLTDLKENELSVVLGLYNSVENSINYEGASLKLSTDKPIVTGDEDFILLKGTLLPNGEFRVIHSDDAETVEHGYGTESFVIKKVA
ncbi:hypothetical protein ACOMCU_22480 [Lysinibacillus sp. UGB7]|uniref:hypothetical protein n=1 Tax=Lysinibacillus sp. UGB7 TaxID=3411039 RepID=UPI003B7CCC96